MGIVIPTARVAPCGLGIMGLSSVSVGEALLHAYRDLVPAEARLGEALSRRGLALRACVADQWPVLHDHLHLYGRSLAPAGMLVLGGAPDAGSRATGIPFTGAPEARRTLGHDARGSTPSPSGAAFWRAVEHGREPHLPLESFFATVHLAHAVPFDAPAGPERDDAAATHVARLLALLRPQAVVAVGADALRALGRAALDPDVETLAGTEEAAWLLRWPPGTPLSRYPALTVGGARPCRPRLVPVPALHGPHADAAGASLARTLALAWA